MLQWSPSQIYSDNFLEFISSSDIESIFDSVRDSVNKCCTHANVFII